MQTKVHLGVSDLVRLKTREGSCWQPQMTSRKLGKHFSLPPIEAAESSWYFRPSFLSFLHGDARAPFRGSPLDIGGGGGGGWSVSLAIFIYFTRVFEILIFLRIGWPYVFQYLYYIYFDLYG